MIYATTLQHYNEAKELENKVKDYYYKEYDQKEDQEEQMMDTKHLIEFKSLIEACLFIETFYQFHNADQSNSLFLENNLLKVYLLKILFNW